MSRLIDQMNRFLFAFAIAFIVERMQSGDEMSKRTKFVFITWLGTNVSTMKRARLSSDKALVKEIIMVIFYYLFNIFLFFCISDFI